MSLSDTSSLCPICSASLPSSHIHWHVENHFQDDAPSADLELARQISLTPTTASWHPQDYQFHDLLLARDLQLAQQLAFAPPSPTPPQTTNQEKDAESTHSITRTTASCDEDIDLVSRISHLARFQIRDEFHQVKDGLMSLLKNCLESENDSSTILSGYVDHFESVGSVDWGWGCGWRNIQMLSSHLLMERKEARSVLFGGAGFVPNIASLQRWLEIAWKRGFDTLGSDQFENTLIGSKKWIGTTECATLFRSFGLKARVVDFGPKESESLYLSVPSGNGFEKTKAKGQQVLFDWVWNYFAGDTAANANSLRLAISRKMPLYFQHDGHSRTIIGVQVKPQHGGKPNCSLLILDPSHKTAALEKSLEINLGWQKLIKRGVHTLKKSQYQLCYIDPGIAYGEELEQLKVLDSVFFDI
uniref:UFSP1/2/DUB catalytic domain-containing protein n=1 Tax=Kalanchoe fedtschenkoi TaxID=63787 RepID=A0A7N0UPD4_KALFE